MSNPPAWFRVLCWSEVILQLPFFFVGEKDKATLDGLMSCMHASVSSSCR